VGKSLAALTGIKGISMLNVHTSGGAAMMSAAALAVKNKALTLGIEPPKLIGVTVLTSINDTEWKTLGYDVDLSKQVVHLAKLAQRSGLDGVVASPQEAEKIRQACGDDFIIVTPGIRPSGASLNDQSRIATPAGALANGAHQLVIGRPITAVDNPRQAAQAILQEMRDQ
jgi:orotidine-5'-phosphate decarboxylase